MVLDLLKKENATWWFTPLSNLVTNQREYEGLHSIRNFQGLMKAAILKPKQELFPKYTEQEAPPLAGWLTPAFSEHLQVQAVVYESSRERIRMRLGLILF